MKAQKINAKSLGTIINASIGFSKNSVSVPGRSPDPLGQDMSPLCRAGPLHDFTLKTL